MQTKKEIKKERKAHIKELKKNKIPYCPRCKSEAISADRNGYSLANGAVGGILFGGVGLLGGFLGSRKVRMTCLNCGYHWKADTPKIFR